MASSAVVASLTARARSAWAAIHPAGDVIESNTVAFDPDPLQVSLIITFPLAVEEQKSTGAPGANVWRETGVMRLVMQIPFGQPLMPWLAKVDALRAAFRGTIVDGVSCLETSPPATDAGADEETSFFISTAVAYRYDIIG